MREGNVWNIDPVSEYEARSAIMRFVGITIRKGYELRQQCDFIFIVTKKES
jgi:hypothetical protein